MKLKEKFKSLNTNFGSNTKYYHHNLKKCEKIADEYAIEFAEWYLKVSEKYDSHLKLKEDTTELLEIYKKEKGLCD
jgi:hypothetical protein